MNIDLPSCYKVRFIDCNLVKSQTTPNVQANVSWSDDSDMLQNVLSYEECNALCKASEIKMKYLDLCYLFGN